MPKFSEKNFSFLNFGDFWHRRWKISRCNFVGEITLLVGAVTERLVGGLAAAAQTNRSAPGKTKFISGWIYDLKIAFDEDGTVIPKRNFCRHEFPFDVSLSALCLVLGHGRIDFVGPGENSAFEVPDFAESGFA